MSWVWTTIRIWAWMPINTNLIWFSALLVSILTCMGLCAPLSWTIPKMSLLQTLSLLTTPLILLLLLCFKSPILYFFARFYVSYPPWNISPEVCFHLLLIWDLQLSVQLKSLTSSKILRIATQYPIVISIWPVWIFSQIRFSSCLLCLHWEQEHRDSLP